MSKRYTKQSVELNQLTPFVNCTIMNNRKGNFYGREKAKEKT